MAKFMAEAKHGQFVADRAIEAVRKCQAAFKGTKPTGIAIYAISANGDGEEKRQLCGLTSTEAQFESRKPIGKEEKAMAKKAKKAAKVAKKTAKAKAPASNRTLMFGKYPVTAVARKLGALDWKPSDAITAIKSVFPDVSEATIRTQVQAGKAGKRGEPASLENGDLSILKDAVKQEAKAA